MALLEQILELERVPFLWLNSHHTPFWDAFMYIISSRWPWVGIVLILLIYLFYKKPLKESILVIIFIALSILCCDMLSSHVAKPLFARFRPTHHPAFEHLVLTVYNYRGGLYGFFSGHASNFVSIAMLTSLIFKNKTYSYLVFGLALLVAYSRIYLGVHFISDIVVGIIIGLLIGWLLYKLYTYLRVNWICPTSPKNSQKVFRPAIQLMNWGIIGFLFVMLTMSFEVVSILRNVLPSSL